MTETLKTSSDMPITELVHNMLKGGIKSMRADILVCNEEISFTITIDAINFNEVASEESQNLDSHGGVLIA